ncbi:hypothetical protein OM427_24995 [Halomonas sp. 18H]|nr:hypothetical protein [Halomonas sp. 18H]MCW4152776.1 hypothetical protein [Halomonas sp. 18H]
MEVISDTNVGAHLQETAYLLRTPKNAQRLLDSVAELEQGEGQEKESPNEATVSERTPED